MGSVIDYIECPNCKQEAFSDFYYKTGEEYINCESCGYHYSANYRRHDDGEFVTKDNTKNYSFDNMILDIVENKNPYGSYSIKIKGNKGEHKGSLNNKEEYDKFISDMTDVINKEDTLNKCTISRLINGNIVKEVLIDNSDKH